MIREIRAIRRYLFAGLGLVVVLGVSSLPSRSLIPPERATHADLAYARQLVTRLRWVNRASMPTARSWASAVEYGGKIYVVGGCSSTQPQQFENPVANLEMYDPETDTWTRLSPMSLARVGPAVAVLNGKIYVMGGFDPMQYWSANPTVEIYDIKTGRWSRGPSMPTGVSWASAVVLDGKIYCSVKI